MRLVIKQCRYCKKNPKHCLYRQNLKALINAIKHLGTLTHSCTIYKDVIPVGSKVEIELHEIRTWKTSGDAYNAEPPETYAEWIPAGTAKGKVINLTAKGFFIVELDEPHILMLPEQGQRWTTAREVEVTHMRKRAKDITVMAAERQGG